MPFRRGYEGIYDRDTLDHLQDVFEAVSLIVADAKLSVGRGEIVQLILDAHNSGMPSAKIRQHVIYEIFRRK